MTEIFTANPQVSQPGSSYLAEQITVTMIPMTHLLKPRLIVIVRHGESEANCNRHVNHNVPNHLVKLTERGIGQASVVGKEIAAMIEPGEKVVLYQSPYMRTRQTAEQIIGHLDKDNKTPIVIEEPRLREQDFGNFQDPGTMHHAMEERARYGSFFYRIPDGESAADVYDRCASFATSLHRHFEYYNPDVVVLVSHGIWGRVFLMKWFGWKFEAFENLKNLHYCDPIVMQRTTNNTYDLITKLPTWDGRFIGGESSCCSTSTEEPPE